MWQNVSEIPTPLSSGSRKYRVTVEGQERKDGTWAGRLAFTDDKGVRRTGQETSQPDRKALEYWATGLEKIYLEGALARTKEDEA
jgi:hypothetical protein